MAAAIRAGGSPQGEPLCGYHTPSSGCSGLKEQGGEQQDTLPSAAADSRPPLAEATKVSDLYVHIKKYWRSADSQLDSAAWFPRERPSCGRGPSLIGSRRCRDWSGSCYRDMKPHECVKALPSRSPLFSSLLSNWKLIFSKLPLCASPLENKCRQNWSQVSEVEPIEPHFLHMGPFYALLVAIYKHAKLRDKRRSSPVPLTSKGHSFSAGRKVLERKEGGKNLAVTISYSVCVNNSAPDTG